MIDSGLKIINKLKKLIKNEREYIGLSRKDLNSNISIEFTGITEYVNKLISACEKEDILLASYVASELQTWLAEVIAYIETGHIIDSNSFDMYKDIEIYYNNLKMPVLSKFTIQMDFKLLRRSVLKLSESIQNYIQNKKMKLKRFSD